MKSLLGQVCVLMGKSNTFHWGERMEKTPKIVFPEHFDEFPEHLDEFPEHFDELI